MTGLLLLSLLVSQPAPASQPAVADQRIVLRTIAGDMVLALYPDIAPRHVAQLLKLVELGVYDTTHFFRVEPGFVVQISEASDRRAPLTKTQAQAIQPIAAEWSAMPHRRGTLSMARRDNERHGAETSFSILLGKAPHLDGRYTVFGHVERGLDVLDKLAQAPRGPNGQFLVRLEVYHAEVVASARLSEISLAPARDVMPGRRDNPSVTTALGPRTPGVMVVASGIALMIAMALANNFLMRTRWARFAASLNLIILLVGTFLLLVVVTPLTGTIQVLGVAVFFGMLALFKVMSGFERPGQT